MSTEQLQEFIEDYAKHFDLLKDYVFNTTLKKAFRNVDDTRWCIEVDTAGEGTKTLEFDKIVLCHGYQNQPIVPTFEGQDKFEGVITHSQQYRS